MIDITFRDLLENIGTAENIRRDGCVLADINETAIQTLTKRPFRLEAYSLILCTDGECVVNIGEKEYRIASGDMLLATPMFRVSVHDDCVFSAKGLFLCTGYLNQYMLPMLCSPSLLMHIVQHPVCKMDLEQYTQILAMMQNICWVATNSNCSKLNDEAIHNGIAMFLYVIGDSLQRAASLQETKSTTLSRRDEYCFRFIDLLAKLPKISRRVDFYADRLCLTPKYLTTLVREATGKSAKDWIDDFIISNAQFLLRHSDMSIQQIAFELNFPNQSFFGKFFKEHTGYSPSGFRSDNCNLEGKRK